MLIVLIFKWSQGPVFVLSDESPIVYETEIWFIVMYTVLLQVLIQVFPLNKVSTDASQLTMRLSLINLVENTSRKFT